jgi:sulfatase maturation enzyme AslB (radical SAM superfamily)
MEITASSDAIEIKHKIRNSGSASLSVLIEPTSACNLDCRYCYKGEKPNKVMDFPTFETAAQKAVSLADREDKQRDCRAALSMTNKERINDKKGKSVRLQLRVGIALPIQPTPLPLPGGDLA